MDHMASEFYHVRHQLLLINPYEMIFMLSAPAVILWSVLRRKSLQHYLLLGMIYVVVLYPTLISAMSLHWDLISQWQASAGPRPAALESMLTGNGPKMIVLVATGWGLVAGKYLFWLLVLSPAVYLSGRKRGPVQCSASEVPPGDGRLVLSGPRAVAGVVSEIFIVLGVVAALAAGPCAWVSLQSDAPPMARPMIPMFFVVGVSFLAVGLLARGIESTWAATLSLVMAVENGSSHRRMSPSVKCAIVVAGGGMALLIILGWCVSMLAVPIILALLLAGLSVLAELIHGGHRTRYYLWQRVASLAGIVGLLWFFAFGHGSAHLSNLRTRAAVALTGGTHELQSWAVQVLAASRQSRSQFIMQSHSGDWSLPKEQWSDQVNRLAPNRIIVDSVVFQGDREALCLVFGGGLSESRIVVGSRGAGPIENYERCLGHWLRWDDGIYGLYRKSVSP